ncbi:MAG: hypothetical protein EBZ46_01535 [Actinobacteria bacterium]|nr:hypothetical protein [Actinomycetota bacterium]NCZ56452.1 hypothetical protein [Acidimicrobiia bacterium]NCZ68254.1 hypothetical protein [Acidimicrobiia bacterium]NCZ86618.1 hypothetical protein [Actinomycetota bacterium]NCZ88549.1 hypothetical protein [Actinomycetota bacterium]
MLGAGTVVTTVVPSGGVVVVNARAVVVVDSAIVVVAAGSVEAVSGAATLSLDVDASPQAASTNANVALIASNRRLISRRWCKGASLVP